MRSACRALSDIKAVIKAYLTMDAVSIRLRHGSIRKFRGALSRAEASGKDEVKHKHSVLQSYSMIPKLSICQIIHIFLRVCASRECGKENGVLLERRATGNPGDAVARTRKSMKAINRITLESSDEALCYLQRFKVLVCREHATAVQNLETHASEEPPYRACA